MLDFLINLITSNYVTLMLIFGLWIMLRVSVHASKEMIKLTRVALLLLVSAMFIYNLERFISDDPKLILLRYFLTYSMYSIQPIILIFLIQIVTPLSKKFWWLYIPEVIAILIYYTSYWTHWVCYFEPYDGGVTYLGGPIGRLPYIVFIFYIGVFLVQNFYYFRKLTVRDRLSVLYIIVISVTGMLLFMIFEVTSDYSSIFTAAIVLYYLFVYIYKSRSDALTGLLNRQSFYRDLQRHSKKLSCIVSVDMNELKWVNDNYGHDAGDTAIKEIARCLTFDYDHFRSVYRIGGDEFIILYYGRSEEEVIIRINTIKNELAKTSYVCAFGYSMINKEGDFELALRKADEEMYKNKAYLKEQVLKKGGQLHLRQDD